MQFTNITWCNEYKGVFLKSDHPSFVVHYFDQMRVVGQRVASTFSAARRVYLLGDAGKHIHLCHENAPAS